MLLAAAKPRLWIKWLLTPLLACVFLELFAFNFRTVESLLWKPVEGFTARYESGEPVGEVWELPESGRLVVELERIHAVVNNLSLRFAPVSDTARTELTLELSARDEGNAEYYGLPEVKMDAGDAASQYVRLNLSGEATALRLSIKGSGRIAVHELALNVPRPLQVRPLRMALVCLAVVLLIGMRPSSSVYRRPFADGGQVRRAVTAAFLLLQLGMFFGLSTHRPDMVDPPYDHHHQYAQLARAMANGHLYLEDEPPEELKSLSNPYDPNLRRRHNVSFKWDTAYYEGHYYVYFGVAPVIVYYLPHYLLTGRDFSPFYGIFLTSLIAAGGLYLLIAKIARRWFPKASLGLVLLVEALVLLGSGIPSFVSDPSFYMLPMVMGLCFVIWGLYAWLCAAESKRLTALKLGAGSLCMAAVAACRPQLLLACLFAVPLFWPAVRRVLRERSFTRRHLGNVAAFALPVVAVAALLMAYNAARFGSPLDFGANYNLTTNDMTKRGWKWDRVPLGVFTFLFQPPNLTGRFPFIADVPVVTSYQGITIAQKMCGGTLMLNPFLFAGALVWKWRRRWEEKRGLFTAAALSLAIALAIVVADAQMSGMVFRYLYDFTLFLSLPAAASILAFEEAVTEPRIAHTGRQCLWAAALYAVVIQGLWLWYVL